MDYHRSGQAFKQWKEILRSWLLSNRDVRLALLQENPDIFSVIDKSSKSDITVFNDIIFIRDTWRDVWRDGWKAKQHGMDPQSVSIHTMLDEFADISLSSNDLARLF